MSACRLLYTSLLYTPNSAVQQEGAQTGYISVGGAQTYCRWYSHFRRSCRYSHNLRRSGRSCLCSSHCHTQIGCCNSSLQCERKGGQHFQGRSTDGGCVTVIRGWRTIAADGQSDDQEGQAKNLRHFLGPVVFLVRGRSRRRCVRACSDNKGCAAARA